MTLTDYMYEEKEDKEDLQQWRQRWWFDTATQRLHRKELITASRNKTDKTKTNRTTLTRKQKWEEMQYYDRFKQPISKISHEKIPWTWLRKRNLKRESEYLLIAAQNNAIRANHIKSRIDITQKNSKCRLCGNRHKTLNHIRSKWRKLAEKKYNTRHDWVGKMIHRESAIEVNLTIQTNGVCTTQQLSYKMKFINSNVILTYKQIT